MSDNTYSSVKMAVNKNLKKNKKTSAQISDCYMYVHICGIFAAVTVLRGTH